MSSLIQSLAISAFLSVPVEAAQTFTLDFDGDDFGGKGFSFSPLDTGDTTAFLASGSGDCGSISSDGQFFCATGIHGPEVATTWELIDLRDDVSGPQTVLISFDIAGESVNNLNGSGRWIDFIQVTDGDSLLFDYDGGQIWSDMPLESQFYSLSFETEISNANPLNLAVRVSGNGNEFIALDNLSVTTAVPEPASWMMMLAGFGLVGAALRRRGNPTASQEAWLAHFRP